MPKSSSRLRVMQLPSRRRFRNSHRSGSPRSTWNSRQPRTFRHERSTDAALAHRTMKPWGVRDVHFVPLMSRFLGGNIPKWGGVIEESMPMFVSSSGQIHLRTLAKSSFVQQAIVQQAITSPHRTQLANMVCSVLVSQSCDWPKYKY
jgi:hypothetical protein